MTRGERKGKIREEKIIGGRKERRRMQRGEEAGCSVSPAECQIHLERKTKKER